MNFVSNAVYIYVPNDNLVDILEPQILQNSVRRIFVTNYRPRVACHTITIGNISFCVWV